MSLMLWQPKYSVGVAAMDAQHKTFFTILNRLHEAMAGGKGREVQQEILSEAVAYTRSHFLQEELFLKLRAYPKLAEHKEKHANFVQKLSELEKEARTRNSFVTIDLLDFLQKWLLEHILQEDAQYGAFLQTH